VGERKIVFSDVARRHLDDLEEYLSERFYPTRAEKFVSRLVGVCESLVEMPERGVPREDLGPGVRTIAFERRATIYFEITEKRVVIPGICYGGRLYETG
jgi:toxin ParE1/3/4